MKRFFILTFMLCCCLLQGFAEYNYDRRYLDENGIEWSFQYDSEMDSAIISGINPFGDDITIPEKVKDNDSWITVKAIAPGLLQINGNLHSITLPPSFTTISDGMCEDLSNLNKINLENCIYIGNNAFKGCGSLTNIDLSACKEIGNRAFQDCGEIVKIDLPLCQKIGNSYDGGSDYGHTFENCRSLIEVNLPNCEHIEAYTFANCINLTELTLYDKINCIGDNAFNTIERIVINAKTPPFFYGGNLKDNILIFVPKEALNLYKSSSVWSHYANKILAIGEKTDYDVTTTALDDAPGLLQQLDRDKLNNIVSLKVSGTINGYDIMLFRNKMDNLQTLDLSDADIVANPYEYYGGRCTQDSILGDNAFTDVKHLVTIYIPKSIKEIAYCAFSNCSNLKNVIFQEEQNLKIGSNAFSSSGLKHINLPKGTSSLEKWAFSYCTELDSITIPEGIESIPSYCFQYCESLCHIELPSSLKWIGDFAFKNVSQLRDISLPGITYIGQYAFERTGLREIKLPNTLERIDLDAFRDCNLNKVYTYTVLPISITQNTFENFQNIALYVPTQSVDNYYFDTQWSQFKEIHEFDEPYTYFYLDKEFTLEKRFDGTPDIDIKEDGGLKVDGKDNQEAGDVTIKGDGDKGNSGTLITDGNLNAKMMRFDISVTANKWYFFSFPFDINMANVKAPGEYKWKRYDGKIRSDQGSGGWVDLASNEEWLKQGEGYIFQTNQKGILTLRVTKEKFGQLDATNIMKPLDAYPSGNIADASWNFIGNPQTSYFNVNDLGYDAPITVWNGNSYEAVRPGDDDYTLHPFQAFFVQKPAETSGIEFKAEDRLTKTGSQIRAQETKARRLARGVMPSRLIINLNVTDGTQTDKTRVVFNNQKSRDYEIDCDAAKFMTMGNAPQLYSVEGKGTQYAINERPMGSVQLGFTAKKSGTFTISAARMDQPMLLEDKQAGITFDLTNGDYEFTSGAGTFNSRFMLIPSRGTTGIADIVSKTGVSIMPTEDGLYINGTNGKSVQVFNLNGIEVANRSTDGMLNPATGVYIVKVNGMSTKVMVK